MLYIFLKCLSRIHYSPHRALERTAFQQPLHLYNESNHKKVTRHPIIFSTKHHTSLIRHLPFPFHSLPFLFRSKNSTFTPTSFHFHSSSFIVPLHVRSYTLRTYVHTPSGRTCREPLNVRP